MIDHIMLMVENKGASQSFYESLLSALGYSLVHNSKEFTGFGRPGHVPFWLKQATSKKPSQHIHIAFSSPTRQGVRQFYETAIRLGAKSNGEPGLRPEHGEHYYAAYIYDPSGHNIEAVCYAKQEKA